MIISIRQKKELAKLAKHYSLDFIFLFGSQAIDRATQASDIDIAVVAKNKLLRREYAKIISEFSVILKTSSDKIDLTEVFHADPLLLYNIMMHSRILYGNEESFNEKKMYAIKRFMDHKKFFNLQKQYINEKLYGRS